MKLVTSIASTIRPYENSMKHVHVDVNAREKNKRIIEIIAAETHLPFDKVERVFDDEYARLKSGAHVFDYIGLFAARHTREILGRPH